MPMEASLLHRAMLTFLAYFASLLLVLIASPAAAVWVDVADSTGVADTGTGRGVAFGDIDGDGDLDLYVSNVGGANRLYLNDGGTAYPVDSTRRPQPRP